MRALLACVSAMLIAGCSVGAASAPEVDICRSELPDAPLYGVRLGATRDEVKRDFAFAASGTWSVTYECAEPGFEWKPREGTPSAIQRARFELHDNVLVAVRLRGTGQDAAPTVDISDRAVIGRRPNADGTRSVVWLDMTCPEHGDELQQLLTAGAVRE